MWNMKNMANITCQYTTNNQIDIKLRNLGLRYQRTPFVWYMYLVTVGGL